MAIDNGWFFSHKKEKEKEKEKEKVNILLEFIRYLRDI